jgi:hypothetical protein
LISAILPDGAVKPGDTWTKSYDEQSPVGSGSVHVATRSTYQRDEKVAGVNAAVVQSGITTTLDLVLDMSALAGKAGMPMLPATASPSTPQSGAETISIKGTSLATVTSWVDAAAHRVVKTHSTGSVDATVTVNMPAAAQSSPMLTGPIAFKGTQTLDMSPA